MKTFSFIAFSVFVALAELSMAQEITSLPCSKDSDCVLYDDFCEELQAVLESSIPLSKSSSSDDPKAEDVKSVGKCNRAYIIDPKRNAIKNPIPRCVKKTCVIVEGPAKSK